MHEVTRACVFPNYTFFGTTFIIIFLISIIWTNTKKDPHKLILPNNIFILPLMILINYPWFCSTTFAFSIIYFPYPSPSFHCFHLQTKYSIIFALIEAFTKITAFERDISFLLLPLPFWLEFEFFELYKYFL